MTASVASKVLAAACGLSLCGCFALKPPKPIVSSVELDGVDPTATIEVRIDSTTAFEDVDKKSSTCPPGHSQGSSECVVTHYTVKEPVTRTETTMVSGSHRLSYAQFLTLTERDRPRRVAALEADVAKCKRARIPRYVSVALGVVGVGLLIWGSTEQNAPVTYAGIGAGGAALVAGGTGLIMAKGSCNAARNEAAALDLSKKKDIETVRGAKAAQDIQRLADEHNARASGSNP